MSSAQCSLFSAPLQKSVIKAAPGTGLLAAVQHGTSLELSRVRSEWIQHLR